MHRLAVVAQSLLREPFRVTVLGKQMCRWFDDYYSYSSRIRWAQLDTATGDFSLSPPAERGERVGERGTNAVSDKGSSCLPA